MKHKILYFIGALMMSSVAFTACDDDQELPPMIMPAMEGNGTVESPFNVAAAIAQARVNGAESEISYFTKGIVISSSIDVSYGNGQFEIVDNPDNGETAITVYRAKDLDNQKFTSADKVKVGDTIIVYAPIINYMNNTPETNYGYLYAINDQVSSTTPANPTPSDPTNPDTPDTPGGAAAPAGEGTLASPYNCAKALELATALTADEEIKDQYVEGVVTAITDISTNYGNATYTIGDEGFTSTFSVYRGYYLDGDKFTSADELKVGDKVIVKGTIVNYMGNTPQFTSGSQIYSINGKVGTATDTTPSESAAPAGDGTEASPYNCAKALEVASALTASQELADQYAVGVVTAITEISTDYGNATYTIGDEGFTSTFSVYRGYYLNGEKFTSADQLKVGDKVTVKGTLVNYKGNTPQFTSGSQIVKIETAK